MSDSFCCLLAVLVIVKADNDVVERVQPVVAGLAVAYSGLSTVLDGDDRPLAA